MKKTTTISASEDKELTNLAGEYVVASELCRRGHYAQLTLGNHKKADLMVVSGREFFNVSVKAKKGRVWPGVKGIWEPNDILVFVDFKGKSDDVRPDFYIVGVTQWKAIVKNIQKTRGGTSTIDKENTLCWGSRKGCLIKEEDVTAYKDWPKTRQ